MDKGLEYLEELAGERRVGPTQTQPSAVPQPSQPTPAARDGGIAYLDALAQGKSPEIAKTAAQGFPSHAQLQFEGAARDLGQTAEQYTADSTGMTDVIDQPAGEPVRTGPSQIHGQGSFTTAKVKAGEPIATIAVQGNRTQAGRFMNHADQPNAHAVLTDDGRLVAVAQRDLAPNEEVTVDYRQAVPARRKLVEMAARWLTPEPGSLEEAAAQQYPGVNNIENVLQRAEPAGASGGMQMVSAGTNTEPIIQPQVPQSDSPFGELRPAPQRPFLNRLLVPEQKDLPPWDQATRREKAEKILKAATGIPTHLVETLTDVISEPAWAAYKAVVGPESLGEYKDLTFGQAVDKASGSDPAMLEKIVGGAAAFVAPAKMAEKGFAKLAGGELPKAASKIIEGAKTFGAAEAALAGQQGRQHRPSTPPRPITATRGPRQSWSRPRWAAGLVPSRARAWAGLLRKP